MSGGHDQNHLFKKESLSMESLKKRKNKVLPASESSSAFSENNFPMCLIRSGGSAMPSKKFSHEKETGC